MHNSTHSLQAYVRRYTAVIQFTFQYRPVGCGTL